MKKLLTALACLLPFGAMADTPTPPAPAIAEIFECTLNEGVSAADVATFGRKEVRSFTRKNEVPMHAYLWEAIAINDPYNEADVRWVNYYPTWSDYYASNEAFNTKGSNCREVLLHGYLQQASDIGISGPNLRACSCREKTYGRLGVQS